MVKVLAYNKKKFTPRVMATFQSYVYAHAVNILIDLAAALWDTRRRAYMAALRTVSIVVACLLCQWHDVAAT
jgi:hypothetical protein